MRRKLHVVLNVGVYTAAQINVPIKMKTITSTKRKPKEKTFVKILGFV